MRTVAEQPDTVAVERGAAARAAPPPLDRVAPAAPARRWRWAGRAGGALVLAVGVLAAGVLLPRPPAAPPAPRPPLPADLGIRDRLAPPPAALPAPPSYLGGWDNLPQETP